VTSVVYAAFFAAPLLLLLAISGSFWQRTNFGSYPGYTCRAFDTARPADRDPFLPNMAD
jgi:hypothetical protein